MPLNLNYNSKAEYKLYDKLTDELIDIFGIPCQYINTNKVELDIHGFGEWQALKAQSGDVTEVMLLPENTSEFDGQDQLFSQFGLSNFNEINFFISRDKMLTIHPDIDDSIGYNQIVSDLIVLPSNKVLEITKIEPMVPGINNLYSYADVKNVYKIYCTRYTFKQNDELKSAIDTANNANIIIDTDTGDVIFNSRTQDTLDNYFDKLLNDVDITNEPEINNTDINQTTKDGINISDELIINSINITDTGSNEVSVNDVDTKVISTTDSIKTNQDENSETIISKDKNKLGDLW